MMEFRSAKISDLTQIMEVESKSFIPEIQEKREVFAERIITCPKTFLVFTQNDDKLCGYICAEFLHQIPQNASELALNHHPQKNVESAILYISSFALLPEYRGKGQGSYLWSKSINYYKTLNSSTKKILLLVNEQWKGAFHIYKKSGFTTINTFTDFFPTKNPSEKTDGFLMELNI